MRFKYIGSSILVALISTGCAAPSVREVDVPTKQQGMTPHLGEISTAPVGAVLFNQFDYLLRQSYSLSSGGSIGILLGKVVVSPGDTLKRVELDNQTTYCTDKRAYIDPISGPYSSACFLDTNDDGQFEAVKAKPGLVWNERPVSPPIGYERMQEIVPGDNSYKYELLYQGVSKQTLRLAYREYFQSLARPAFYQELTYDIDELPTEVTFRGVRIEVLEAGNSGIRYRVLSGF